MTSAGRRMTKIEDALMPREAVLAWLAEAHQYPSSPAYVRTIVELPVEAAPIGVIGRRVEAAVRRAMAGQPRDAVAAPSVERSAMSCSCSCSPTTSTSKPSGSPS